jgi:hypothetical protein
VKGLWLLKGKSLIDVIPDSRWIGVRLALAQEQLQSGNDYDSIARELYENSSLTLVRSKELLDKLKTVNFIDLLEPRKKIGSAENPVTKLFLAAITERHFLDYLDDLCEKRKSIGYDDKRFSGHTLVDFSLLEDELELPINVKNAGTRFERAYQLVGLEPEDCIPIPAYKANDAIEKEPNLLYAIAVDYELLQKIEKHLVGLFNQNEKGVWVLLNAYTGTYIRDAEDKFIYSMVNKYWTDFSQHTTLPEFRIISARKAVKILQTLPKRTPGIGLRAWGTGASAEVNVHISIGKETKTWEEIERRILYKGVDNIVCAVNRKRTAVVYDPEI